MRRRQHTRKIIRLLERYLGVPHQKKAKTNPLDMLIGTVLSQNTNDRNSHRAYLELRRKYPTWQRVANAPVAGIAAAIRMGGMKNLKSRRIKELLQMVRKRNGAYRLRHLDEMSNEEVISMLMAFDGIGFKTAACVLLFSLRRDVFPVDTHIHRICNRLGIVQTKSPDKTFEAMKLLVPKGKSHAFHTNLIRFGRTVCLARSPRCGQCPLYDNCTFPDKEQFAAQKPAETTRRNADFMLLDEI